MTSHLDTNKISMKQMFSEDLVKIRHRDVTWRRYDDDMPVSVAMPAKNQLKPGYKKKEKKEKKDLLNYTRGLIWVVNQVCAIKTKLVIEFSTELPKILEKCWFCWRQQENMPTSAQPRKFFDENEKLLWYLR